jgi:hypothetical protein
MGMVKKRKQESKKKNVGKQHQLKKKPTPPYIKLPSGQSSQTLLLSNLPAVQSTHAVLSEFGVWPAEQDEQDDTPAAEILPDPQPAHTVLPWFTAAYPAGQL